MPVNIVAEVYKGFAMVNVISVRFPRNNVEESRSLMHLSLAMTEIHPKKAREIAQNESILNCKVEIIENGSHQ